MPFARVGKQRGMSNPDLITMAVNEAKNGKNLVIHIGSEISKKAGFKLEERAETLWGYDADLGILILALPEEEGLGVKWKDNLPRLTHTTTRVPEWVLPFSMTDVEMISCEQGELVMKVPKEDEIIKRAPLASSDIKRDKPKADSKITVKAPAKPAVDDQPAHPEPTAESTFQRETKRPRRPDRFRS